MKKYLLSVITACIIFYVLAYDNAHIITDMKETKKIANINYVSLIISRITYYEYLKEYLPDKIEEVYDYKEFKKPTINQRLIYNKKGVRDKSGRKWLVILIDKNFPDVFFVGNLDTKLIINKNFIIDP